MKLVICGEGGLGHETLDLACQLRDAGVKAYDEMIFLDDDISKKQYGNLKVLPSGDIFKKYGPQDAKFVVAVGEPVYRLKLIREIKSRGFGFEALIHPTAYVGMHSAIGDGTVAQRGALISCDCAIGENCFFQPYSTVGHDCVIEDNCVISSNAVISGGVHIGKNTYIAIGACVKQGIRVGSDTVVGMGSMVLRDLPDNVIAVGNPARPMKHKDHSKVFRS